MSCTRLSRCGRLLSLTRIYTGAPPSFRTLAQIHLCANPSRAWCSIGTRLAGGSGSLNIMDAAVIGTPISSPQPTQLTFEDGFGERRYATGTINEPLEVLKLSSVLSSVSSFDFALRERAARLAGFRHESYARVRSIELDRRTSALVVVSDYVPGIRLSTILAEAHKRPVPLEINAIRYLIRQLVSAAAALQEAAPEVSNGAIAPERLVITPAGRLIVVEYVTCRRARATGLLAGTILEGARRGAAWLRRLSAVRCARRRHADRCRRTGPHPGTPAHDR